MRLLRPSARLLLPMLLSLAAAAPREAAANRELDLPKSGRFHHEERKWGGTLSLGIPHPLFAEAEFRPYRELGFGLGAGGLGFVLPLEGGGSAEVSIVGIDVRARWHPWGGSFFVGGALGRQSFSGSTRDTIPVRVGSEDHDVETVFAADVKAGYFTPHFGWLWTYDSGFTWGFDFGIQLAFRPSTDLRVSTASDDARDNDILRELQASERYQQLINDLSNAGDRLGKLPLPYFTAIRVGWMF